MDKRGSLNRLLTLGLALLVAACTPGRGGHIAYNVPNFGAPDAPKVTAVDDVYKLGPLDTVTITVFQVADLSKDYVIDQTGRLTFPLLGRVDASGLSTAELGTVITHRLSEKYLRDPNVTVALKDSKESLARSITVDGSVRQPGIYPAPRTLSLVQAIALAHGPDDYANAKRVAIFRIIDGKRMAAAFDLWSIRRGKAEDPAVYPGDTVIVDGSGLKRAQKELLQAVPLAAIFMAI